MKLWLTTEQVARIAAEADERNASYVEIDTAQARGQAEHVALYGDDGTSSLGTFIVSWDGEIDH